MTTYEGRSPDGKDKTIRAVLFDLDGTLLDTLRDIADAMDASLATLSLPPVPFDEYRRLVGSGAAQLVRTATRRAMVLEGRPEAQADADSSRVADDLLVVYRSEYDARWDRTTKPYDGILPALTALASEEVPMAVLSNKPDRFTKLCVARYFPDIPFVSVRGESEGVPRKPDPAAAGESLAALACMADDCAYLGDSGLDMRFASLCGFLPVGVLWGFRTREELVSSGARILLADPFGIPDLVFERRRK